MLDQELDRSIGEALRFQDADLEGALRALEAAHAIYVERGDMDRASKLSHFCGSACWRGGRLAGAIRFAHRRTRETPDDANAFAELADYIRRAARRAAQSPSKHGRVELLLTAARALYRVAASKANDATRRDVLTCYAERDEL